MRWQPYIHAAAKGLAAGLLALVALSGAHAQAAGKVRTQGAGPAAGLIIQLKPFAGGLESPQDVRERLSAVLSSAQLPAGLDTPLDTPLNTPLNTPTTRAIGRAQLVHWGRRLSGAEAQALANRLRLHPEVAWVEPNTRERLHAVPSDPLYVYQWWLQARSAGSAGVPDLATAWDTSTGNQTVVAVVDTGVRYDHPDLQGRLLPGYDFIEDLAYANDGNGRDADASDPGDWVTPAEAATTDQNNPFYLCVAEDSSWHGTLIGGQIAAATDNAAGVAGVQWDGRVLPLRVAGKCGAYVSDILDAMRWAAGLSVAGVPNNPSPAKIVNLSFGGTGSCDAYQGTINELYARGVLVVASAGNEEGAVTRPAKCAGVLGVAALNRAGYKTWYSNFGPEVGIATVGGDPAMSAGDGFGDGGLYTTSNAGTTVPSTNTYDYVAGTSFSTPIATGVAALMLAVNPALTPYELTEGVKRSALPHVVDANFQTCSASAPQRCNCTTATCGAGILDAPRALIWAANPEALPPAPPLPSGDGGGGGGALGWGGLLGLLLAAGLVRPTECRVRCRVRFSARVGGVSPLFRVLPTRALKRTLRCGAMRRFRVR